jgi:hypothetical protein
MIFMFHVLVNAGNTDSLFIIFTVEIQLISMIAT